MLSDPVREEAYESSEDERPHPEVTKDMFISKVLKSKPKKKPWTYYNPRQAVLAKYLDVDVLDVHADAGGNFDKDFFITKTSKGKTRAIRYTVLTKEEAYNEVDEQMKELLCKCLPGFMADFTPVSEEAIEAIQGGGYGEASISEDLKALIGTRWNDYVKAGIDADGEAYILGFSGKSVEFDGETYVIVRLD